MQYLPYYYYVIGGDGCHIPLELCYSIQCKRGHKGLIIPTSDRLLQHQTVRHLYRVLWYATSQTRSCKTNWLLHLFVWESAIQGIEYWLRIEEAEVSSRLQTQLHVSLAAGPTHLSPLHFVYLIVSWMIHPVSVDCWLNDPPCVSRY